jgi:hypothetical protein
LLKEALNTIKQANMQWYQNEIMKWGYLPFFS